MPFQTINPFTFTTTAQFEPDEPEEINAKLEEAEAAFQTWSMLPYKKRAAYFLKLSSILEKKKTDLAGLITLEMGKPITEAIAEIEKCAFNCSYYAEHAESLLMPEHSEAPAGKVSVVFQPLGAVLGIFPWNYPFWQVIRFAAPTLMAGNVCLVKHAPNVPLCATAIYDMFIEAGFPAGVYANLFIEVEDLEELVADDRIHAATLTGSGRAGASLASLTGKYIKKTVLELGGSDPFIVLPGADLKKAAKTGAQSRFMNAGQSCISAKRFILHKKIADKFLDFFVQEMNTITMGNPADPNISMGPMARPDLVEKLEKQLADSLATGARMLHGVPVREKGTLFFRPAAITDIKKGMPVYDEEIFGPVAAIFIVENDDEALALANDTVFGLGSAVWTGNTTQAKWFANRLQAGQVFINGMVRSDPRYPFGGIKYSGMGRELSAYGIREFTNIKTIVSSI
jgi:succinate-semialdehyde dehydrogenase/glutarate-semialdehyde dehydrogenase